ncbi:uncharacterized protein DUF1722 [Tumebacillus sp. BK434]|uniref:DUF1722 domain-containing protein n=1 Tax=Tumebacillus sp. BK434 TaxID=2512169 RepID=UPI001043D957|nr:DUF1722 domain-containing protein [Tumebacillus sp. BK434]TCP58119.1 uncharacterized protein DUF1722 [Tumebacillus sp. BK434]
MEMMSQELEQLIQERRERLLLELQVLELAVTDGQQLETLWHKMKFVVLEGDPSGYFRIRTLLNSHRAGAISFAIAKQNVFRIYVDAMRSELLPSNMVNLLTHIWGYLKKHVDEADRAVPIAMLARLSAGDHSVVKPLYDLFAELHLKIGKENLLDPSLRNVV